MTRFLCLYSVTQLWNVHHPLPPKSKRKPPPSPRADAKLNRPQSPRAFFLATSPKTNGGSRQSCQSGSPNWGKGRKQRKMRPPGENIARQTPERDGASFPKQLFAPSLPLHKQPPWYGAPAPTPAHLVSRLLFSSPSQRTVFLSSFVAASFSFLVLGSCSFGEKKKKFGN